MRRRRHWMSVGGVALVAGLFWFVAGCDDGDDAQSSEYFAVCSNLYDKDTCVEEEGMESRADYLDYCTKMFERAEKDHGDDDCHQANLEFWGCIDELTCEQYFSTDTTAWPACRVEFDMIVGACNL